METLIIHPYDATTDFLCNSYKDLDNVTVVRDCMISKSKLRRLLQLHQNIVLMGCQQLIKNIFKNIYLCLKHINFWILLY